MKKKFSIKWKILLMFFVIFVLTILAIVFISTWVNVNSIAKLAQTELVEKAGEIKSIIENFVNERKLQAKSIAGTGYVINYLSTGEGKEYVHDVLVSQLNQYGQFGNIFLVNKDGYVTAAGVNQEALEGQNVKEGQFWRLSEEKDDFYLDELIVKSPITGNLVIVLATRAEDSAGNFLGLVCMSIYWDKFINNNILNKKIGETGSVSILDKNKAMIANKNEKFLLQDFSKLPFIQKVYENKEGFIRFFFEEDKSWKFAAYNTYDKGQWKIAITMQEEEYVKDMRTAIKVISGIGLLILLLGSIIIYLFVSRISKVIMTITEGARRFSIGDIVLEGMDWNFIGKINSRNDELGETGQAFSRLIEYQSEKVGMAEKIANGDLNVDVTISSEEDKLGKALSLMVESLNNLVGEVNGAIDQVSSGSNQVAQASQELSQGATEQASSLEEITSSITEISSQSKQNTGNAVEVSGLSKKAMENAENGNSKMKELVTAMSGINNYTAEIKRIVKIIDDIAFQTNLLALNANVEAARAGKYGKGFAVVAEEVRNLASRSAESVSETTQMVENAVTSIDECNRLVDITAKGLEDIMESANKVADLVEEISVASKEQTQGLDQISQGLGQIDQVTQATTASAEESASAAEELAGQAQQLKGIINKFKLKKENSDKTTTNKFEELVKKEFGNDRMIDNKKTRRNYKNLINPKDIIKLDDEDFGQF